jgi:ClpP class serine protease
LIHSGRHKVDGNPYAPLPEAVQGDIQREIDVLRFLFAETVTAGRAGRLSQEAALATEAATYRGADAVAASLADEVIDLTRGFVRFRESLSSPSPTARLPRATYTRPKEAAMSANKNTAQDSEDFTETKDFAQENPDETSDTLPDPGEEPQQQLEPAPTAAAPTQMPTAKQPSNLAELSVQLREAAAEITDIAAQAGRLGIAIDAAKALREGTAPEALRRLVLERASAAADARDIVAAPPSPIIPKNAESPIVAAAKKAASAGSRY